MQRSIDFAPLIRLAGYSWREVEDAMWFADFDQSTIVRPTMTDYISLDPKLRNILYDLTFPPTIYKLDAEREKFTVHIAAAREVADILEVDLSDACIDVLRIEMLLQADSRGERLTDPSIIESLKYRSDLLTRTKDAISALDDCGSSLDLKSQYLEYAEYNPDEFLFEDEFKEWIVSDCLNLLRRVLEVEEQYVSRQFSRACQNL